MEENLKQLLLKDLCARLPYGVKVLVDNKHWCDFDGHTPIKITFDNSYRLLFLGVALGYVKPYLFPMSSMTEEQKKDYNLMSLDADWLSNPYYSVPSFNVLDWLNTNHLDYRDLIGKGLALDATGLGIYIS